VIDVVLQDGDGYGLRPRPRSRLLESTKEGKYNLMTAGEFGDDSITSIPFQVSDFVSFICLIPFMFRFMLLDCVDL
jgi:hypothetical protein